MTLSSFDVCHHHVAYLFLPPHRVVSTKIKFHRNSKGVRNGGGGKHMCRLQRKLRRGPSRRQRGKRVEKFDGWACYPLSSPILRNTIHNEYAIDELINMHDPSRIIDYGNVLRFAPCINNSWSNTPPSTGPGGTARA
jgi:hypothetical protein